MYGVEKEGGVHCFADGVVAAEGEREVGESSGGECSGEIGLDPADCLDEIDSIALVLCYTCTDG